jgi:2-polyprenyl-3-methyl-5-hydroxy-6-metoxy-1,4-benzoquinol methylase
MRNAEKFWDKNAIQWDAEGNKLDQASIKAIENTKNYLKPSDLVLDFGCGIGTITNEIAVYVKEVHAIDISSRMIEVAKRRSGERKIENIHFAQSTLFDERYKNESFNVVMAFNILHLIEEPQNVMERINELLKPGGLFISATSCLGEEKPYFRYILSILSITRLVPYLKMLKISELENLVDNGNFQIVEPEILRGSPMNYFIAAKKN